MAHFHKHPSGQRISHTEVVVQGDSLTVGLWGYLDDSKQELSVTNQGDDLILQPLDISANSRLWKISVSSRARATQELLKDRIYANTVKWETWDYFDVTFRFKKQDTAELVVRPITADLFGGPAEIWRSAPIPAFHVVDAATFLPGQPTNRLEFRRVPDKTVKFAVFAAKLGAVERALVLMAPLQGRVTNLLIVISHSFGQNDAHYGKLGYSNPLSLPLIKEVIDKFVLGRWGSQLLAARNDFALLMPVRAKAGPSGSELGPFVEKSGIGALIIQKIIGLTNGAFGVDRVELVTFSNGIATANHFINAGGKGLSIQRACNQDPAGGASIVTSVPVRKQYLSGYTTGHRARHGFEFLPLQRWEHEPQFKTLWPHDRFNYLHTWCLPQYTLFMALTM
jgi:hypothetical protein